MTYRLCTQCHRMTDDYALDGLATRCMPCADPEGFRLRIQRILVENIMANNEMLAHHYAITSGSRYPRSSNMPE